MLRKKTPTDSNKTLSETTKQGPGFLTSYVVVLFVFNVLRWDVIVEIVDDHCLKFLFILSKCFSFYLPTYVPRLTDILWKTVVIHIDTICAPILVERFLYVYIANFMHGLLKKSEKNLALSFNFMIRYVGDILSLNSSKCGDYVDIKYSIKLEIDIYIIHIRNSKYGKISYI